MRVPRRGLAELPQQPRDARGARHRQRQGQGQGNDEVQQERQVLDEAVRPAQDAPPEEVLLGGLPRHPLRQPHQRPVRVSGSQGVLLSDEAQEHARIARNLQPHLA